jgi:2-succinyl-5-enolpyruvyl-6-hydroxy-3-cyclohexene-1-carboxylate synthase
VRTADAGQVWRLAERLGLPVLTDALSGLRFGAARPERVTHYDSLLRNPDVARRLRPDWVLRLGAAPVSKTLGNWVAGIPSILVDPSSQWRDPGHDACLRLEASPLSACAWLAEHADRTQDPEWIGLWHRADSRTEALATNLLQRAPWCEGQAIRALLGHLPSDAALFCGNSQPIRQLDTWSGYLGRSLRVFCNRGASGIDGNVSTLAGLAAAGIPALGLIGDLTLFHDLGGLLLTRELELALPLVVVNNGGGRIFDGLPQCGLPGFETLWRTPVDLDIGALATPFDLPHRWASNASELANVLDTALSGATGGIIELRIDARRSMETHQELHRLAASERLI